MQRPITEELYELFKPFGYINKELGNKRLGEVYVMNKAGKVVLILQGRLGSTKLKVTIKDILAKILDELIIEKIVILTEKSTENSSDYKCLVYGHSVSHPVCNMLL